MCLKNNMVIVIFLLVIILIIGIGSHAEAQEDFRPALIYESSTSRKDYSFLDSMKKGAQQAKEEVGISFEEYRIPEGKDRIEFIKEIANKGVTHIIAVGFQNVVPVMTLANDFKAVKFTVIDGIVPPLFDNVQSINFKDHEGAFLVGMVTGYLSPMDKIGFIGGRDVPIISNFALGYFQGARYAHPEIEMIRDTVGDTQAAWNNPEKAKALAKKQYNAGVGVIFAAAGGSSIGVLEVAEEMSKLAIGVDTNQNGLFPGAVLTSMVKRVDKVVYDTLVNSFSGRWEAGIKYLGIKENALDYAVDIHNKHLITKQVIDKVEAAKDQIIRGQLVVEVYSPY